MEELKAYPRSSAFEALLSKVYLELWNLQDQPAAFASRVETFVSVFLPSMFQRKIVEKYPHLHQKLDEMDRRVERMRKEGETADPLVEEAVHNEAIPAEEAEFAREVWHAVVDVLTDAGFNFPLERYGGFFDPSRGRKSGTGRHSGFPAKLPDVVL